jgi:hypothetical protein
MFSLTDWKAGPESSSLYNILVPFEYYLFYFGISHNMSRDWCFNSCFRICVSRWSGRLMKLAAKKHKEEEVTRAAEVAKVAQLEVQKNALSEARLGVLAEYCVNTLEGQAAEQECGVKRQRQRHQEGGGRY